MLLRKITKSRKDFEYKMIGLFKNLNDCKNYIQHEHDLLEYIKLRKRNLRMPDRTTKAEHRIIKRIKNLYETGVQRHRTDYNFCKDYYKFLKKYNYNSALSAIHVLINVRFAFSARKSLISPTFNFRITLKIRTRG